MKSASKSPFSILSSFVLLLTLALFAGGFALLLLCLLFVYMIFSPLLLHLWNKLYSLRDIADLRLFAQTQDAWKLAMHLHIPYSYRQRHESYPVIVAHGIAMNKYNVDLDYEHSLPYFLKEAGYKVFAISLRGAGASFYSSQERPQDYNFDTLVEQDLPAFIQKAKEVTGASKVSWIGYSLGALLAQGFLGRQLPGSEDIACFVSLAGPGRLDHLTGHFLSHVARFRKMLRFVDVQLAAQLFSPFIGRPYSPIDPIFYNTELLRGKTIRYLMNNAVENISEGLLEQLAQALSSGREWSKDASVDYRASLKNMRLPSLFIAGAGDTIAKPESVRFAWESIQSKEKEFVLLSRAKGFSADYCHNGLVLGKRARAEVYPIVLNWLEKHGMQRTK